MGNLLELDPDMLHCCIKVVVQKDQRDVVSTIGRSEPWDNRTGSAFYWPQDVFLVDENTVWASLFGRSDGKNHWERLNCFACNNLPAQPSFVCQRKDWKHFYQSSLVFPIRMVNNTPPADIRIVGMLTFDSPRPGSFGSIPDVFAFRDRWPEYRTALKEHTVFQLGAAFADALGVVLTPLYEDFAKQEKGNVTAQ